MRYAAAGITLLLLAVLAGCTSTENTADEPPVRAFRIQVQTTADKGAADATVGRLMDWWTELPPSDRPPALADQGFEPEVVWRPPYYRVRVGRFASRDAATDALATLRQEFPDAFVARTATPAQE